MKIEDALERQRQLIAKWESRITDLGETIIKYPHEKMNYKGADWRPSEIKRRKNQVEESKLIIAALEKQIPKEPIHEKRVLQGFYEDITNICPVCGTDIPGINPKYCINCGQRLK